LFLYADTLMPQWPSNWHKILSLKKYQNNYFIYTVLFTIFYSRKLFHWHYVFN